MFTGFTPETIDFLWGIRMNNNREWFLEHKKQYTTTLYEPMKELGKEFFQRFADQPGNLVKVSRIYRDSRMHYPDPYKESLWICIRKDVAWWAENPCLFFEINPEGIDYGFALVSPRPGTMELFRKDLTDRPGEFLSVLRPVEAAVGMPVTARCYKRPKPAPSEELAPFFAWKDRIEIIVHEDVSDEIFGPQLAQRVSDFLEKLMPLYEYFCRRYGV